MDRLTVAKDGLAAMIRGHRILLLGVPLVPAVLVLIWFVMRPPLFGSTATMTIHPAMTSAASRTLERELTTQAQRMRSGPFMRYLFDGAGEDGVGGHQRPSTLLEQLTIAVVPGTRLLQLSFTAPDPDVPQRVLEHLTAQFMAYHEGERIQRLRRETRAVLDRIELLASGLFSDLALGRESTGPWLSVADGFPGGTVTRQVEQALMKRILIDYDRALQGDGDPTLVEPPLEPVDVRSRPYVSAAAGTYAATWLMLLVGLLLRQQQVSLSFPDRLARRLNLPLAGVLPLVPGTVLSEEHDATSLQEDADYAEAMRSLRTTLLQTRGTSAADTELPRRQGRVVLVAAPESATGTSTVAINLALMAGQVERVLLLDANLRAGSDTGTFCGLGRGVAGLSHLVAGAAPMRRCLYSIEKAGIDVIPAGVVPPNPQELLSSLRFRRVLRVLKYRYDLIIIDGPATHQHGDAELLSSLADQLLYVVRPGRGDPSAVMTGLSRLRRAGNDRPCPMMVCNAVDVPLLRRYGYTGWMAGAAGGYRYDGPGGRFPVSG
ncbi:MAG: hypothetical protein ACQETO_01200 [Pseudomonadota bacterium]